MNIELAIRKLEEHKRVLLITITQLERKPKLHAIDLAEYKERYAAAKFAIKVLEKV